MSVTLPSKHAAAHAPQGVRLLRGEFGATLGAVQGAGLLPELPAAWAAAFCAGGFAAADTANTQPGHGWRKADGDYQAGAFHELGYWQSKGGRIVWRREGERVVVEPAPGPDREYNDWRAHAQDPDVVRALGRAADCRPGAWKTALRDQHAIGLAMLRDDYASVLRALPADLRPATLASDWARTLMFMAFSAGPAAAAGVVGQWASTLRGIDDTARWKHLCWAAAREYAGGTRKTSGSPGQHGRNPAHTLVRQLQKSETARAIALALGDATVVWTAPAALERVLVAADEHKRPREADVRSVMEGP